MLLLIFSQYSIASNWVAYEVERALNKEPKGFPNVLYPIRLDDEILICTTSWAQDIKDTRQIGDFTNWKAHDSYQKSFDRLLRALKQSKSDKEYYQPTQIRHMIYGGFMKRFPYPMMRL